MEPENFDQMSDEDIIALMANPEQEMAEGPDHAAEPPAEALEDVNQAPVPPSHPADDAAAGRPMVPLAAVHEERQKRQQLQSLLEDPHQLAQLLQERHGLQVHAPQPEAAPELLVEDQAAIEAIVQQAVAPYAEVIDQLRAERQQMAMQRQMHEAQQAFGSETGAMIAHFDQIMPHLSSADPFIKAAAVNGARWADPEYRQQQIEARAKEIAAQQMAEALKQGGRQTPVTLSGVTPAANDGRSLDDMSDAEVSKLSDSDLERFLKSAYGNA